MGSRPIHGIDRRPDHGLGHCSQATGNEIPDLASNTLEVVKLTSIAIVVALPELLYAAGQAQSITYNATPIIFAGIVHLVCLWLLVRLLSRFDHKKVALH